MTDLYVSKSQIETFRLCPRKWAYDKIDKNRAPPNASAQLGTDVHDLLEKYLRDGIPLDVTTEPGQIAMSGVQHLPLPQTPGMTIERGFTFDSGTCKYIGYKDFENLTLDVPLVGDHKTTKNFSYALDPDSLAQDVQSAIYAVDAFLQRPDADRCELLWVYYRTTGSRTSRPVSAFITKAQAYSTMEAVEETAKEIKAVKATCERAEEVPFNTSGCQAYGGCHYYKAGICPVSKEKRLVFNAAMKQANKNLKASLMEKIRKSKGVESKDENASPPEEVPNAGGSTLQFAPGEAPKEKPSGASVPAPSPKPEPASKPSRVKKPQILKKSPPPPSQDSVETDSPLKDSKKASILDRLGSRKRSVSNETKAEELKTEPPAINPPDEKPAPPDPIQNEEGKFVEAVWSEEHSEWVFPGQKSTIEKIKEKPAKEAKKTTTKKTRVKKPQKTQVTDVKPITPEASEKSESKVIDPEKMGEVMADAFMNRLVQRLGDLIHEGMRQYTQSDE